MPSCPICGAKVSEDAGFCPKCLLRLMTGQAGEGKSKKKLIGIIVACVIVISALAVIATRLPKVPSGGVAEVEYLTVSAYDFARELFNPQLTTLQREDLWQNYAGKQVRWIGELKYVSLEGEAVVAYFLDPLDWARIEVEATFDASQRSSLLNVREGDLITYTGILASLGTAEIRLTHCIVVSPVIVPLWWNDRIDTQNKRILVGDQVLCLGPGSYDDAAGYVPPGITALDRETGELLWEADKTESVLVGIDSSYVYAWHLAKIVAMSARGSPRYWFASEITASDKTSGQIGWRYSLSSDVYCLSQQGCLPDRWSDSGVVNCCVLRESVREEIADRAEPGLTFLIDKPPLSELTYEHRGVTYKIACAVYGGGTQCGALQALDGQTGDILWMMTFKERGVTDFSVVDGILYISTDDGVGAYKL